MKRKTALITGAAHRIGRAITCQLYELGYHVIIHANQSKEAAVFLKDSLNQHSNKPRAELVLLDLRDKDAANTLIHTSLQFTGQLDLLVNNASLFIKDESLKKSKERLSELYLVNVALPHQLSDMAYPFLREQRGAIINLTDIHATHPLKDYQYYAETKAALNQQTRHLARQFAPFVRVNAVAPGAIAWPEGENTLCEHVKQKIIAKTPLQRHGTPEDIAFCVGFLSQHTFITGQIIHVDGGRSLNYLPD